MNHRQFHATTLAIAAAMLLAACGPQGKPPQQGATLSPEPTPPPAVSASTPAPTPAAAPVTSQPATAALREFIDPVTGQPRQPTAAELKALATAGQSAPASAAASRPKETVLPNGMVAVEVGVKSEMKGCLQADGRVVATHDCQGEAAAPAKKP